MELLLELDKGLFLWINTIATHQWFDVFFAYWTDIQKTPLFYAGILPLILFLIFLKGRWPGLVFFVCGLIAMATSDYLNSNFIKPQFLRERPAHSEIAEQVILRVPEVGGYGFPSSHAVDGFCFAAFIWWYFPSLWGILFSWAALTSYSRVYCGVHFPLDVLGGALVGISLGLGFAVIFSPMGRRLKARQRRHQ